MANEVEITHATGTGTTESQYLSAAHHELTADGQTAGDVLYFDGTKWRRGTVADLDFSGLPLSDPHVAGKLYIDMGGTLQVSAG